MTALIRVDSLTKRFGSVVAVDALTVDIPRGAVGLVGANGAGKTTLMRMLMGLTDPQAGTIEVAGIDVKSDPVGVRARVGFMPEHDCLPTDQSAADLVSGLAELSGLPRSAARQRASDVLALVGLGEARFRSIDGYSTGMKQRTKLAQAIVGDPELVLLDEPTAGLDPIGRQEMLLLVERLVSFGISVVLSTHLLEDVERTCDHVVMLSGGKLVAAGPTSGLLAATGTTHADVGMQPDDVIAALAAHDLRATRGNGHEIVIEGVAADIAPVLCAVLAERGWPLNRMGPGHGSLDDVFVDAAVITTDPGDGGA